MVSCDRVFFVLTQGPFPNGGSDDAAVEEHLVHCSSCRRMAEALRPAASLVPETVTPEESRMLPSYWGSKAALPPRVLSAALAEFDYRRSQRKVRSRRRRPRRIVQRAAQHPVLEFLKFSLAVLLGLTIAFAVFMLHF